MKNGQRAKMMSVYKEKRRKLSILKKAFHTNCTLLYVMICARDGMFMR